jgi:hypothetical protein
MVRLKKISLQHLMFFSRLFTICSALVSALVTVFSDSPCERIGKWEIRPITKDDILLGARLAGASVTKPATLLSLSRATV